MRIRNLPGAAVAAAISAIVFSAAFSPAEASPIVLDKFSVAGTASGTAGSGTTALSVSGTGTGVFGPFNRRVLSAGYTQTSTQGTRTASSVSTGTGTGLLQLTNVGTGTGTTSTGAASASFKYATDTGNSWGLNNDGNDRFWIETLATSSTSGSSFVGYIEVVTGGNDQTARVTLPSMWAPNTGISIPFSSFEAVNPLVNFFEVDSVTVGIVNQAPLSGATAYNATANFAAISVVPEPPQMASLAGIGAAYGAWRLRKGRRARRGCSGVTA